ncbi:hypothetical protein [Pyrobaculum islandicum]|nr:hypothetical protein [Pyrobaculum islandicum]
MSQTEQTKRRVIVYTNHQPTIQILTSVLPGAEVRIPDRSKSPVEEITTRYQPGTTIVGVMPLDSAAELILRGYSIYLTRLDGKKVEEITGRPYNPKEEYPPEVIRQALVVQKINRAEIRYLSVDEMLLMFNKKTIAVFNDVMREALQKLAQERGIEALFTKEGRADVTVGIPPTANRIAGIQISFPGITGRLDAE